MTGFAFAGPRLAQGQLFPAALALSFLAHGSVWIVARACRWARTPAPVPVIEVDLRTPFRPRSPFDTRLPGAAKGSPAPAPKPTAGVTGPRPAADPVLVTPVVAPTPADPSKLEKEWVLPGPQTKVLEKPELGSPPPAPVPVGKAPGGEGPGGERGRGGSGGGPGTGEAIVNRPPRLVNRAEIQAGLRSAYPVAERLAGREGQVMVALLIGEDGRVRDIEVIESAGAGFDGAARRVAWKMIFEPALVRSVPTAVKVRQAVTFRLGD